MAFNLFTQKEKEKIVSDARKDIEKYEKEQAEKVRLLKKIEEREKAEKEASGSSSAEAFSLSPSLKSEMFESTVEKFASPSTLEKVGDAMQTSASKPKSSSDILALGRGPINYEGAVKVDSVDDILRNDLNSASAYGNIDKYENRDLGVGNKGYLSTRRSLGKIEGQAKAASDYLTANKESSIKRLSELGVEKPEETYNSLLTFYNDTAKNTNSVGKTLGDTEISGYYRYIATGNSAYKGDYDKVVSAAERYKTEKNPNLKKYSDAVKDSVSLMKGYAMGEVDKYVEEGVNGETLLLWAEDLRKRAAETTDKTTRKALNERASTIEEYTLSKGLLGSESQAKLRSKRERVMAENEDATRLLTSVNAIIDMRNGAETPRNDESPYSLQYYATTTRGKAVVKYLEDNGFSNESLKVASEILTDYKNEYDRANYFLYVSQKEYYDAKWTKFEEENSQNGAAEYEASRREMQKAKSDMDGLSEYSKPYAEASERYAKASVPNREAAKKLESAVGKEAAEEYFEYVNWKLSQEEGKAFEEETKKRIDRYMGKSEDGDNIGGFLGGAGVVGENIATFATNLLGIAYTPIHWVAEGFAKDSDKPFDEYGNTMMTYTNAVRGATGENIENNLGRKVYEGVMSSIDSVAMAYLGGAVGKALGAAGASAGVASTASKIATGVTFGISSAENMAIDVTSRGGTREQALASGVVAGIAETLFESWSIGKFNILKESGLGGFKNFASDLGKGVIVNFSEEGNTELANGVADILINGGASQYAENVRMCYFSGMSLEDAKREASKQFAWQVLDAAKGGAMQGFLMGSVGGARSSLRRYVIGLQMRYLSETIDGFNAKIRHLLEDAEYLPKGSKEAEYIRPLADKFYKQGEDKQGELTYREIGSISEITSNFFAENEGLYREAHAEEYAFSDEYDNAGKKKRRRLEKQVVDEALGMPDDTEAKALAEKIKAENGTSELGKEITMNLYAALLDARKAKAANETYGGKKDAVIYSDSEKALIEQGVKPELARKGVMALTKLENGERLSSNEIDILRSNDVLYGKTAEVIGLHAERASMTAKGFREAVRGYTDTKQAELAAEVAKASAENGEAAARLEAEAEARAIESEIKTTEAEVRSENEAASFTVSEARDEGNAETSGTVSTRTAESGEAKGISENRVEGASTAPEGAKFAEPSENVSVALGKTNASAVDTVNTDVASTGKPVTVESGEAKRYASPSESVSEALAVGGDGSAQQKNVKAEQNVAQTEQNVAQEERKGDISENADVEQKSYAEPVGSVSEAMGANEGDEVDIDIEGESEGESKKPAEVVVKKKSSIWSPIARFFRSGTTAVDVDSDGMERKTGITDSPTFLITGEDRSVIRETAKSLGTRVSYMDDSTAYTSGKNVKGSASASGRDVRIFLDNIRREVKARAEANGEVLSEKELNARIASEAVRVTYHEFGHIMEVYAKEAFADFKALAKERYIKKHGEEGFRRAWEELNRNEGRELSEGEVESELACDMIPELLEDKKFLSLFEKQMNRDRTAFGRFLNALGELLSRVRSFFEPLGFTKRTDDEVALRKLYIGLRQSFNRASAEYRRQERQGTVAGTIVVNEKTGEVLRRNEESEGEEKHNLNSYDNIGRNVLSKYLSNSKNISKEYAKEILAQTDRVADIMREIAKDKKLTKFNNWQGMDVIRNEKGEAVSVIVNNGEYKLNIDFTQVCKKRYALDAILNKLVRSGMLDNYVLQKTDVAQLVKVLKEHDFEVACALCFVDSKRYRVGNWAQSFCEGKETVKDGEIIHKYGYNEIVRSLVPDGSDILADEFNFTGKEVKSNPNARSLSEAKDSELDFSLIKKIMSENDAKTEIYRIAKAIKTNPRLRKIINYSEMISSVGLDTIRTKEPALYALVNSHEGTAKPKLSNGGVVYLNNVIESKKFTPSKALMVGGVRIQSFSDFMSHFVFDYVQLVSELSAKELTSHAYTKEPLFVKLFGMTGIKINMSLVPKAINMTTEQQKKYAILKDDNANKKSKEYKELHAEYMKLAENAGLDDNGNYIWEDETFPFDVAVEIMNDKRYEKNCGTIAVGISGNHIRKLLADPRISMVIPYHRSGMDHEIALMRDIALYIDYSDYQNTRDKRTGKKLDKKHGQKEFDFYADLYGKDGKKGTNDPKTTAKNYLAWCEENGYIPKFDEFKDDPNYYKLLVDFRVYDDNGNYLAQQSVKPVYPPDAEFTDLILNGVKDKNGKVYGGLLQQQETEDRLENESDDIIREYGDVLYNMYGEYVLGKGENDNGEKHSTVDTRKIEDSYEKDSIDNEEKKSYNIGEENKRSEYTGEITSYNVQERKSVQRNNRQGGSMESEGLHTLSGKPTVKNDTEGAESSIRERKSKAKRTRLTSDQLNSEQRRIVEQNRIEFAKNTYFSTTPLSDGYLVDGDEIWLYSGDFENNDLHFKNGTASFTEDRLKSLISEYSVKNYSDYSKDYAKAYVAYISPDEFISLTTPMPERIEAEALDRYKSLNEDSLKESGNIFLIADFKSGEVEGHEGRHRMVLLKNAGIERVAIVIKDSRTGDSVKYNTDKKTNLTLTGESFARGRKATGEVTLDEVIPLSPRFRDEVNRKFVSNDDIGVKYSTVDTRKLGEELDREKAEGAVADGVTDNGITDGGEGLNADGMGDAEGGDEVGDGERILPEYNSRGQKVSRFAETVADVGMRLNEAGRTEEGTDMVEAAKRIAENPVEYKTEPMSHKVTAKAAERAREKDSDGTEGKTAIIKAIERFNTILGNSERVAVLNTEDTYNVLYYAEEARKLGLVDERDELFAIAAENFNRSGRIVELAKLLSEMSGAAYEKYMKRKEENINRTRRGKIFSKEKQRLFDDAVKLGNEKREREGELEKVKAKLARISEKYRKAQAEIARLEAERNSEYSDALFEAEEKLKALGDELVKAKEEAKKAKEAAAKARHELKAAQKELDKMPIVDGEEYGGADSENGEVRKKLAEARGLKKRIRNLEGMIAGKADGDEKKAELEKRVETLKETLKQKEDELRAVGRSPEEVKAIEKLLDKIARLENKVKKLTEAYELSDEEKTKKEQRISELEAEIQSIYNGDGERMGLTELRKQLASAKGKEKRRGERIERLTKELAEKEAQIEEIARKYPEYEKLIEEEKKLQSRVKYLQKQIDRFADESGKPVDIQAEIDRLNAEIEEKKAEKRAIAEKNPELAKLFEAERRLKSEIREIENYKSGKAQENAKKRIDKLNEKLEKLNKEYASFAEDKEKVRKEVEEAKKKVSERSSDLAILKRINKKLGANAPVFIGANLIEQYRNAEDPDERQKIVKTIVDELISEIPHASFLERLDARRHLCMLFNIKTPARNVIGNTANYFLTNVSDSVATLMETMYYRISGDKNFERTKASAWSKLMYSEGVDNYFGALAKKGKRWLGEIIHPIRTAKGLLGNNLHSEAERESKFRSEVLEFLEKDADMMQGVLQGKNLDDGKGDDIVNMFNEQRRIFKSDYYETLRKLSNASLETPDLWFLRSVYKSSLLSALAARKIDINDLASEDENVRSAAETALASARDYAVRRAKEVTFREQNWLSDQINEMKKNTIGKIIINSMFPYVKTPANVAKQSLLNSPVALGFVIHDALSARSEKENIMRAEKTGNEAKAVEARAKYQTAVEKAIEDTAKGFTGTALLFAGYMLSKGVEIMGTKISLRFGGGDDDDYEDLLGYQDLSFNLEFGDKKYSISLSQFSPAVVPLLIGSLFRERMSEDDKEVSDNILGALWGGSSKFAMAFLKVLVDTTMLSNVDDFISDINSAQGYTKNDDGLNIMDAGLTLALGYLQQFLVPTYISHLTKAIAGSGMRSYKDTERDETDFFRGVQKRFINKIGGLGNVVANVADYTGWEVAERLATFKYVDEWGRTSGNDSIIGGVASIVSGKYSDGSIEILKAMGIEIAMPFFASEVIETEADKEILRLREALGTSVYIEGENSYGIYPETAKKTVDFLGGSVRFSAREYEQFATVKGKTQRELIEAAVGREDYQKLSDGEKAKIIDKIYNLAEKIAAKEVIGDKYASGDKVYNTAVGRDIGGMLDILLYENALSEYKADTGDLPSEKEKTGILLGLGYGAESAVGIWRGMVYTGDEKLGKLADKLAPSEAVDVMKYYNKIGKEGAESETEKANALLEMGLSDKVTEGIWKAHIGSETRVELYDMLKSEGLIRSASDGLRLFAEYPSEGYDISLKLKDSKNGGVITEILGEKASVKMDGSGTFTAEKYNSMYKSNLKKRLGNIVQKYKIVKDREYLRNLADALEGEVQGAKEDVESAMMDDYIAKGGKITISTSTGVERELSATMSAYYWKGIKEGNDSYKPSAALATYDKNGCVKYGGVVYRNLRKGLFDSKRYADYYVQYYTDYFNDNSGRLGRFAKGSPAAEKLLSGIRGDAKKAALRATDDYYASRYATYDKGSK